MCVGVCLCTCMCSVGWVNDGSIIKPDFWNYVALATKLICNCTNCRVCVKSPLFRFPHFFPVMRENGSEVS